MPIEVAHHLKELCLQVKQEAEGCGNEGKEGIRPSLAWLGLAWLLSYTQQAHISWDSQSSVDVKKNKCAFGI